MFSFNGSGSVSKVTSAFAGTGQLGARQGLPCLRYEVGIRYTYYSIQSVSIRNFNQTCFINFIRSLHFTNPFSQ